jgi:hypothetical protein
MSNYIDTVAHAHTCRLDLKGPITLCATACVTVSASLCVCAWACACIGVWEGVHTQLHKRHVACSAAQVLCHLVPVLAQPPIGTRHTGTQAQAQTQTQTQTQTQAQAQAQTQADKGAKGHTPHAACRIVSAHSPPLGANPRRSHAQPTRPLPVA